MKAEHIEISKFLDTEYPLNRDGLEEMLSLFQKRTFKKGIRILHTNQVEKQIRFLNRGVLREFYISTDKETNINFYTKPQFITDISSFTSDSNTRKNQESLTEIELLCIDKKPFRELLEKFDCGKDFMNLSFQKILKRKELLEYNRITKTADELYQELFIYKPHWLEKIPQYYIASYLNITPETLSRIRKRIS